MPVIGRNTGGNWDSDRHPHEPKIRRQLASNGACFVCELMEETRIAEQRLRGAVGELEALREAVRAYLAGAPLDQHGRFKHARLEALYRASLDTGVLEGKPDDDARP